MKNNIYIMLLNALFMGCGSIPTPIVKAIEGVYVNQAESEYSKACDTVVISPFDAREATFIIKHKTGFFRRTNGIVQAKQYKVENSIAVFDNQHLQLQEQKRGVIYSFTNIGDEMIVAGNRYKKIQ